MNQHVGRGRTRKVVAMQRFINDPDFVVDDTVRGFVKAHGDLVKLG